VYICVERMGCDLCLGLEPLCSDPLNDYNVLQTGQSCILWQIVRKLHATDLSFFLSKEKNVRVCMCVHA